MKSKNYTLFLTLILGVGVFLSQIFENPLIKFVGAFLALCGLVIKALRARYTKFDDYIEKLREKNIVLRIFLENRVEKKQIIKDALYIVTLTKILAIKKETEEKNNLWLMADKGKDSTQDQQIDNHRQQFSVITGHSGNGKSHNLRGRFLKFALKFQELLKSEKGQEVLKSEFVKTEHKIPVFIELKSLDQPLNDAWIKEEIAYAIKRCNEDKTVNKDHLAYIIDNHQITYFFDALDEVNVIYREQTLAEIIRLSEFTSVFFTCRTEPYEALKYKRNNYKGDKEEELIPPYQKPVETKLKPLTDKTINSIIENYNFDKQKELPRFENKTAIEFAEAIATVKNDLKSYVKNCHPKLKEQLKTPIFLNCLIRVFPNLSDQQKKDLQSGNEEDNFYVLWSSYEKIGRDHYDRKYNSKADSQLLQLYTIWIAKIVGDSAFSAMSIQPYWLKKVTEDNSIDNSKWLQKSYYLITRVLAAILIGIGFGCIISTPFTFLSNSVLAGIVIACVTGLYMKMNISDKQRNFMAWPFSLMLFFCLILVCGLFQGMSVPRAAEEMTFSFLSLPESYSGILLAITLASIFSYRIVKEKSSKKYILPVESFHFNWVKAMSYSFVIALLGGLLVGSIALAVRRGHTKSLFFNDWLIPQIEKTVRIFYSGALSEQMMNIAVFCYGFSVMFVVAFLLVTLLVGPYNEQDFNQDVERQALNFNVQKSALKAMKNASYIALLALVVYILTLSKFSPDRTYAALKIASGFFLLGFFWYGGMEVINFAILKGALSMLGIIPASYEDWYVKYNKLGLIAKSGKQMRFEHDSIARFYAKYKADKYVNLKDRQRTWGLNFALGVLLLIFAFLLAITYYSRTHWYWEDKNQINIVSQDIRPAEHTNLFVSQKSGELRLKASKSIHVGTFVGRVWPQGTKYGFLGIALDSAYNVAGFGHFRHAALLVRKKDRKTSMWSPYEYVANSYWDNEKKMHIEKGDILEFVVNDKEWQNNLSTYRLTAHID